MKLKGVWVGTVRVVAFGAAYVLTLAILCAFNWIYAGIWLPFGFSFAFALLCGLEIGGCYFTQI